MHGWWQIFLFWVWGYTGNPGFGQANENFWLRHCGRRYCWLSVTGLMDANGCLPCSLRPDIMTIAMSNAIYRVGKSMQIAADKLFSPDI